MCVCVWARFLRSIVMEWNVCDVLWCGHGLRSYCRDPAGRTTRRGRLPKRGQAFCCGCNVVLATLPRLPTVIPAPTTVCLHPVCPCCRLCCGSMASCPLPSAAEGLGFCRPPGIAHWALLSRLRTGWVTFSLVYRVRVWDFTTFGFFVLPLPVDPWPRRGAALPAQSCVFSCTAAWPRAP